MAAITESSLPIDCSVISARRLIAQVVPMSWPRRSIPRFARFTKRMTSVTRESKLIRVVSSPSKVHKTDLYSYEITVDRGCQSDLPANEKSCNGLANCFECDGKNCNSLSEKTLTESTKCQRCTSEDAGCLAGTAPAQSCGQTGDSCFVRINSELLRTKKKTWN